MKKNLSRREFIGTASMATAAFTIVPRHVLGGQGYKAPSDTLNIACVGIHGKGESDIEALSTENIVALCDVDMETGIETRKKHPKANQYQDFRVMLEKEKNIDAVSVSTPDHTHAVIAMAAMQRGKHVFVQKPLTKTVYEARKLAEAAKKYKIVSQMGNQGHAGEGARLVNEWIWDGAIGDISEIKAWTNRPIWPQGELERPKEIPSVPSTLDWNIWLGPAKHRPYHPDYHPFSWRGWRDFGTGALGDMGAHIIDQPFWALDLGNPKTIQASSTKFSEESFPLASIVTWTFEGKAGKPDIKFTWSDGNLTPPRPEGIEPGRKLGDDGGGVLYFGTKGHLMHGVYGDQPRLIPETFMQSYKRPEKTILRSPGIHEEWVAAIKNGTKSTTDFEYSARLTELMLLGNIAILTQEHNTVLEWDANQFKFTNLDEANQFLQYDYSPGWSLD
ncbi:MAG: Gfo/Idh/MocA family oxidoreductase [Ignavibacteriae bacterium]|nr:Gfo/Idh/MocA family oxidoreductase [Ignavibacteriota bacterium]MCB0747029.1 Gfo/Idh/MocA family oxidoreductase [Ignavibacteriota bacterium]